ncbi:MAG: MltA domain-containing protein [Myxococcales bacterium]|nr:MltA domain-containing protein [Myxococcales bacterium]
MTSLRARAGLVVALAAAACGDSRAPGVSASQIAGEPAPGEEGGTAAAEGGTAGPVGGTGAAVGGTGAAVGGTAGPVGGTGAAVGGTAGPVGGTGAAVGGTGAAVGGTGAAVGGTGAAVGGTGAAVGGTAAAEGGTAAAEGGTAAAVGGTAAAVGGTAACPDPAFPAVRDELRLAEVSWDDLPGWPDDTLAGAVPAFLASCARLARLADHEHIGVAPHGGRARDWRRACAAAARVPAGDHAAARAFFEREFRPYAASSKDGPVGKLTGYYVASLRGSRTRHGRYQVPIHGRPRDLVSVDLTQFVDDARGRRLWGRLDPRTGAVVPYPTRQAIREGALDRERLEILWVDSKVDALFAEIEGSGRVTLDDGGEVWLEFDGKNGRTYKGVGKLLRELGELQPGEGTMQGIRAWFERNPDRVDEIIDQNPSKVFFKLRDAPGATGSQGVVLTPRRSMAIDRAYIAHSTPIWVETRAPLAGRADVVPWRQLLVAQDTGGGILGPIRGDIYWGDDDVAEDIAGRMGGPGRFWLLLPRGLRVSSAP